jgi:hypothetical protein
VHKIEKKGVYGQPTVEARARARDGGSRRHGGWGALAEQGEAGSGHGRRPPPWQFGPGAKVEKQVKSPKINKKIHYPDPHLEPGYHWLAVFIDVRS